MSQTASDRFQEMADRAISAAHTHGEPVGVANMTRTEGHDLPQPVEAFFKEWIATKLGVLGPHRSDARVWLMYKAPGEGETLWHGHNKTTAVLFLNDHTVPLETEFNGRITQHIPRAGAIVLMPPLQQHHIPANNTDTERYTLMIDWA